MNNSINKKTRIAAVSIASNTVLIILKIIAGVLSGSVSIISEAIHSGMDLIAALIAFFSVRYAAKPADRDHPFGHGKMENISGVLEGLLIFVAAFLIIIEAVKRIFTPSDIEQAYVAIGVMLVSGIVNYFVSKKIYKVAKEEDSIALEADALHLKTDVYTSLGVGVGLLLIKLTGLTMLDPIVAILVALLIIKEAYELCTKAFSPLLDAKLSDEEENRIIGIIEGHKDQYVTFHKFRTRKSGCMKYVDFHLLVNGELSVKEAHDLCEDIQSEIEVEMSNLNINIHIEPIEEGKRIEELEENSTP